MSGPDDDGLARVERRLRRQAAQCGQDGSALMHALLTGAADDIAAGGVCAELLAPHAADTAGSALPLRLAAGLHRLVLERRAPELALHYPSVGGTAAVARVWPAAERACREHLDTLRALVDEPVQTNEVGRSAALLGVLLHAVAVTGLPVRLLEVGASAGLNLRVEAFAYEIDDDVVLGAADSPVRLVHPWAAGPRPPSADVYVVSRAGCDPAPLDPGSPADRLVLTSCVWADQLVRFERLRAAFDVAARRPVDVERAGAASWLAPQLAEPQEGAVTVVWHSVVWQYLDPAERDAVQRLLSDAGDRSTRAAPLVHAGLEPERVGDTTTYRVQARLWPGRARVHLADGHGHGPPLRWTGAGLH